MQDRIVNRAKSILAFVFVLVICFTYYLTAQTGLVPGANTDIDTRIAKYKKSEEGKETMEGSIIDADGEVITVAEEKGVPAKCLYPEAYSPIVGYHSAIYGTSGLRRMYSDQLLYGGKDKIGATIQLTTDNAFQQYCYDLIGQNIGSITVLDNTTGAILAMASRSNETTTYDVNKIDELFESYSQIDDFFYNRAIFAQDAPGSIFKIVTSTALIENGEENYIFDDKGDYNGIHNASKAVYGKLDLQTALKKSSNTYFASAGHLLGGAKLYKAGKNFMLGENIDLDFTTLMSNYDLEYYQSQLVAQTAFGQGRTQISALQIGMILQSLVNDGEMLKPYLIKQITDDKKTILEGKKEILTTVTDKATAKKVKKLLHQVAVSYDLSEKYGTIYAKTGTAQVGNHTYNHIYLAFASEKYTGIISMDKSRKSSHSLTDTAKAILDYLD